MPKKLEILGKKSSLFTQVVLLLFLTSTLLIQSNQVSQRTIKSVRGDLETVDEIIMVKQNINKSEIIPIGNKVLLQPYYWEMPDHGAFYRKITEHIPEFAAAGFDSLWLPPPSKTEVGVHAMGGYEPYDYYDLGEYDQKGRVRTHYGTRAELEDLIAEANNYNIGVICDVVINHRRGGELEYNPYVGDMTPTNFMNIASGKLKMNYTHFWPNAYGTGDTKKYGTFPDISHKHPYVQSELISWGLWLRDEIGFDGWRFDTADGIDPSMLRYWMQNVSGWGVAERWMQYPDRDVIDDYIDDTNNTVSAFDLPLLVELRDMANMGGSYDMRGLIDAGLAYLRKNQAVTYAVNHDTYRDVFNIQQNRHMAYAYILTHEGYPSVFWMDWVDLNLRNHLKTLVKIHNQYAYGSTSVLYADADLYVALRNGNPGLIVGINDHPTDWKTVTVSTKWTNRVLHDLTSQAPSTSADSAGEATLSIPPSGYAVFSVDEQIDKLFNVPKIEGYTSPTEIINTSILLDGDLDYNYGLPFYMDKISDGMLTPADLANLYLKHDNSFLYIGFGYYGLNEWNASNDVHYGIALDVREGGSNDDPWVHPKIRWSGIGNSKKPDIIYYLETSSEADDYRRKIDKITRFDYDNTENWNDGIDVTNSSSQFVSGELLGFIEVKIPLSEIDMENGGLLGIKVFSTIEGFEGAFDSVPQDDNIDLTGETDSWLSMPETVDLIIYREDTTTTSEETNTTMTIPTTTSITTTTSLCTTSTAETTSSTSFSSTETNQASSLGFLFVLISLIVLKIRKKKE